MTPSSVLIGRDHVTTQHDEPPPSGALKWDSDIIHFIANTCTLPTGTRQMVSCEKDRFTAAMRRHGNEQVGPERRLNEFGMNSVSLSQLLEETAGWCVADFVSWLLGTFIF